MHAGIFKEGLKARYLLWSKKKTWLGGKTLVILKKKMVMDFALHYKVTKAWKPANFPGKFPELSKNEKNY